ncbi:MAG: branched-chain amino acid ABC transporter substrate-binding protein, partial [Hyphomicrobiales bacterium]|nr:branched-chain amino acid ABC transporter substrate-binding protein [Hyphomicrobiales bacterium]
EVLYEGINTGEKDYSALVSKLKAANVDLVYFGGLHTEAGLIIRQMRDQGLNAPMMSGDGITDKEFAQIGGPGTEGTLMTFAPDPRKHPEAAKVVAEFKAKNYDPEAYTLYSYAAVQIMAEAAKQVGKVDTKKMAEVMHSGKPFKTVIGDIAYDKKGDITRPDYVMYVWKKNSTGAIDYTNNEIAN